MGPKDIFVGPRLKVRAEPRLQARAAVVLVLASVLFGAVAASALAAGIGVAVQSLLHALRAGGG